MSIRVIAAVSLLASGALLADHPPARPPVPLADALKCDLSAYSAVPGLAASVASDVLTLTWDGGADEELRLGLTIEGGVPTFHEIAARKKAGGWSVVAANVKPEYRIVSGIRRMSNQQLEPLNDLKVPITDSIVDKDKWDAFWDAPLYLGPVPGGGLAGSGPPKDGIANQAGLPRTAEEVKRGSARFHATACSVKTDGARLEVSFPGMDLGVFTGGFQVTVYKGANLIRMEAIGSTREQSVAYKLQRRGLSGLPIEATTRVAWQDLSHQWQSYRFGGAQNAAPVTLKSTSHVAVAERPTGSIAAFPPPHTFFWAREIDSNLGYNWYRKDSATSFSFGIQQAEQEGDPRYVGNFPLYSAPPGTVQHMPTYFYVSPGNAQTAFDGVLAFTHGDRFKPLDGYQVMAHHFHTSLGQRWVDAGSTDARFPDFEAVKSVGINIFSTTDPPPSLKVQAASYEAARKISDKDFLFMPSVEIFSQLMGGHTDVLLSHPVFWVEGRDEGAPIVQNDPTYGPVYHIKTADELMDMLTKENGVVFMPHPRTKGSTGYPDAIKDTPHFNHERYRGVGWRWGMGLDLSAKRLSEFRVLPLMDDMNNWVADKPGPAKTMIAINETYDQHPGDDVYAAGPINYVKVATLPPPGNFGPIVDAIRNGDFFVTSGEVLIPSYQVTQAGGKRTVVADVEWTFPLEFVEAVWGDGTHTDRKIVSATGLAPFGKKRFEIEVPAGAKWVRFAAWDSAGNGAMAQPVKLR